jgi:hypothetical protein
MYRKANRFMIGSRRGSSAGNQGRGGSSDPQKAAAKSHRKNAAILAEERKILIKKQANQLRVLKEQQRVIAEKEARAALREAIIASSREHTRLRSEVESQKTRTPSPKTEQLVSKKQSPSRKPLVVRRGSRDAELRTGLVGKKAKPAAPRRHK